MNETIQMHEEKGLNAIIAKLSAIIGSEHYPSSDRAALKRYSPGAPVPLAFYRLWLKHIDDEIPSNLSAWATVTFGLAYMGKSSHKPERSLGQALAEAGYSEARLEQMFAADHQVLIRLFTGMIRFLATKGEGFNWTTAARLVLTGDKEKLEAIHKKIASDYYRSLFQSKEK